MQMKQTEWHSNTNMCTLQQKLRAHYGHNLENVATLTKRHILVGTYYYAQTEKQSHRIENIYLRYPGASCEGRPIYNGDNKEELL